eukprot:CAMPEP_0198203230 /NCGR_PEP_ID=MMETSP1445-20131203/6478_1 /TAXON_ID=36898 /ORGANISM="Pyramimonas sp., Strain CCMP2087" /LENGTH=519 /DNA_ID=CAMNT_0043874521 /DNA_START=185 /DNA_END=1740 /DNA_ORIENTATION=-
MWSQGARAEDIVVAGLRPLFTRSTRRKALKLRHVGAPLRSVRVMFHIPVAIRARLHVATCPAMPPSAENNSHLNGSSGSKKVTFNSESASPQDTLGDKGDGDKAQGEGNESPFILLHSDWDDGDKAQGEGDESQGWADKGNVLLKEILGIRAIVGTLLSALFVFVVLSGASGRAARKLPPPPPVQESTIVVDESKAATATKVQHSSDAVATSATSAATHTPAPESPDGPHPETSAAPTLPVAVSITPSETTKVDMAKLDSSPASTAVKKIKSYRVEKTGSEQAPETAVDVLDHWYSESLVKSSAEVPLPGELHEDVNNLLKAAHISQQRDALEALVSVEKKPSAAEVQSSSDLVITDATAPTDVNPQAAEVQKPADKLAIGPATDESNEFTDETYSHLFHSPKALSEFDAGFSAAQSTVAIDLPADFAARIMYAMNAAAQANANSLEAVGAASDASASAAAAAASAQEATASARRVQVLVQLGLTSELEGAEKSLKTAMDNVQAARLRARVAQSRAASA